MPKLCFTELLLWFRTHANPKPSLKWYCWIQEAPNCNFSVSFSIYSEHCNFLLSCSNDHWYHAPRKPFPHLITQSKHVSLTNLSTQLFPWPCDAQHHHVQGKTSSECRKRLVLEEKHLSKQQQHKLQLHHLLEKPWQVTTCCLRVLWGALRGGLLRRGGLWCRALSQLSLSLLLCLLKPQSLQPPTDYC